MAKKRGSKKASKKASNTGSKRRSSNNSNKERNNISYNEIYKEPERIAIEQNILPKFNYEKEYYNISTKNNLLEKKLLMANVTIELLERELEKLKIYL